MTTAVAIFVKTPGYSALKTRLAASIGQDAATTFHCLAAHAVAEVARAAGDACTPLWAVAERTALAAPRWQALPRMWQGEGALGQRLHRVYSRLQTEYSRVLLLGADTPQITPNLLRQACAHLHHKATPFVLGNARDGGFWLFGGSVPIPREVWCGVPYSRFDTAACLRAALTPLGDIVDLASLTDVDQARDLATLARALASQDALLPAQRRLAEWLGGLTLVSPARGE